MSNGQNIQVWDKTLGHSLYTIDTSLKISKFFLAEKQNTIVVYDSKNYYEIGTENLEFKQRIQMLPGKRKSLMINPELLPKGYTFFMKNLHEVETLGYVRFPESLSVKTFPFDSLEKCFGEEDYQAPIMNFAEYYFKKIKKAQRVDRIYGPINPLTLAIYHNDTKLMEELFDKFKYPKAFKGYWSPLEYSFRQGYHSAIKVVCDNLVRRTHLVEFSKSDFVFMLESGFSYCHKLISTVPVKSTVKSIPKLIFMKQEVKLNHCKNVSNLLTQIKNEEKIILDGNISLSEDKSKKKAKSKTEVKVLRIPFKYDFSIGSLDSLRLLDYFSESKTEEFVLSTWKEIIRIKWKKEKWAMIFIAILYWFFMVACTLSVVFYPGSVIARNFTVSALIIILIYEFIQILAYSVYKISK